MKSILLAAVMAFCCYDHAAAQADLSKGLLAYYPFKGNANDVSGHGNHGTVHGATLTADQAGHAKSAYYFNGSGAYIVVKDNPVLSPTGKFSVCARVNMQGFYNDFCYNNVILAKGLDRTYGSYSLRTTTAGLDCSEQDTTIHVYRCDVQYIGVTVADIDNKPYVKTHNWDCLVGTYENDTVRMYVNGVLRYKYYEPAKGTNTDDLYIGMLSPFDRPFWFNGIIDEVRLYDRALSTEEINLYCGIGQTTAIPETDKTPGFRIYPNPGKDIVQVDCNTPVAEGATLMITDLAGRVCMQEQFSSGSITKEITVTSLQPGLYFMILENSGNKTIHRFVRE